MMGSFVVSPLRFEQTQLSCGMRSSGSRTGNSMLFFNLHFVRYAKG